MTAQTPNTEKELLELVAQGDQAAYKILFSQYWDHLYSTALVFTKSPELSEDLTQDVFVQIWLKRERLKEVEKFDAFLFITARNLIIDRLRKKVFSSDSDDYYKEYLSDKSSSPVQKLELKELEDLLQKGIGSLTPLQQQAFRLSRFEGLSHQEIAGKMGISHKAVKSHIVRAIVTLRKYMEKTDKLFAIPILFLLP